MELKLLRPEGDLVRMAVRGRVSRPDWDAGHDPLVALYGADVYQQTVLLSLQDAQHVDSSGVGWLLACHRRFQEQQGRLILHSASPLARQIFQVMRMHLVLPMADTEADAKTLAAAKALAAAAVPQAS